MKLVMLESPYAGNPNYKQLMKEYLQACIRDCLRRGESPYASHQMLTEALDDNDPVQRTRGVDAGFAFSSVITTSVFYLDYGMSPGMVLGRLNALEMKHTVLYRHLGAPWSVVEPHETNHAEIRY